MRLRRVITPVPPYHDVSGAAPVTSPLLLFFGCPPDRGRSLECPAETFFYGGSRNFHRFIDVFSRVFVLEIDLQTLNRRLTARPEAELSSRPAEQRLIRRLHATSCLA
jgi:hypothetical protein